MIEAKAEKVIKDGKEGIQISTKIVGSSLDVVAETLAIIESLMKSLKANSVTDHLVALQTITDNPWILSGEEANGVDAMATKAMAEMMSKNVIKKGVN